MYHDYQPSMKKLFDAFPIKSVLEFGVGQGTHFLLANTDKVVSVELQVYSELDHWFENIRGQLANEPRWEGIVYKMEDSYEDDDKEFIEGIISRGFGMVFVDPATYVRPLIVKSCIDLGVNIVVAHDTNLVYPNYAWSLANDGRYYEVKVHSGRDTTYYFKNEEDSIKFKEIL